MTSIPGQGYVALTQPMTITAVSLDTFATVWSHQLPYQPIRAEFDDQRGRFLLAAPGGRLTVYDDVYGGIVGIAHLPPPAAPLTQVNLPLDWQRDHAYYEVGDAATRSILQMSWTNDRRRTLVRFKEPVNVGAIGGLLGKQGHSSIPVNQTLLAVDQTTGYLYIGGNLASSNGTWPVIMQVVDPESGRIVSTLTVPPPANVILQNIITGPQSSQVGAVVVQDGTLFCNGEVKVTSDLTGPQTVNALLAIRFAA